MRHGSLFSGIGGFDLAAQWMGWENIFHCEINPFGRKILEYYWPQADSLDDIIKTDFTKYANKIDILTGGFPCQPYSHAGKRLGKNDDRHLWPEMCRAIKEIAPRWIVGENVRGLTTWNGGMVFDEVCVDLENLGYSVAPYLIPACAVDAPHKRERIFFIAYSDRNGLNECDCKYEEFTNQRGIDAFGDLNECNANGNATDTNGTNNKTWSQREILGQSNREKANGFGNVEREKQWQNFPTQPPICGGDDGLPTELDGITFSKWRAESIKGYGNAIVPQVVYQIFQSIQAYEDRTNH